MAITQDRLISLIAIADETLGRLSKIHLTLQSYIAIAKQNGGGQASPHLLYQTLLDLDVLIQREKSLNSTALEVLVRERTHFAINMRSNKRATVALQRVRQNLELDSPSDSNVSISVSAPTKTHKTNLTDILPIIFNAYSNNPNDDGGYLTGPQLMTTLSEKTGILDEAPLRQIIETLAREDYLLPGKTLPDEWFLNLDK